MPVLPGWIATSPDGGFEFANLSAELHGFTFIGWPHGESDVSMVAPQTVLTHWPVSTVPASIAGFVAPAYGTDFYHRIHVRPGSLALGNIVTAQTAAVAVWNAHLVPQTLIDIQGLQEGLTLGDGTLPPAVYAALQEVAWTVNVARSGPSRIDTEVLFVFAGVPAPPLRITGGRVVEWAFRPDWTDGITERLAWLTSVQGSPTGAEQRRALRLAPRRGFEAPFIVEKADRALADLALAAWGGNVWALPVWPDAQRLAGDVAAAAVTIPCATAGRDFAAGALVMLIGATPFDVESAQVQSVAVDHLVLQRPLEQAWPAGTVLCPARTAELVEQPRVRRKNDRLSVIEAAFELAEVSDWPEALPATLYRGAPVLATRPEESEDLTHGWERLRRTLDQGSSLPRRSDTAGVGFALQGHRWALFGRTEQAAWRSLLYALRGQQVPVWLPTHAEDLVLAATAASDALSIDVQRTGYARLLGTLLPAGRRDIRVELSDGSAVHRRITGAVEQPGQLERLTLDASPGVPLRVPGAGEPYVTRISWLQLCRLASDDVELLHVTDADGAATCQVVWRALRDELELA